MENISELYEKVKDKVKSIIRGKIQKGIQDAVVYAAKKYLGISFTLSAITICARVIKNFSAIKEKLSQAYDLY